MSCGIGHRHGLDLALLATSVALKRKKKKRDAEKIMKMHHNIDRKIINAAWESSHCGTVEMNPISMRMPVGSLALPSGLKIQLCREVRHRSQTWLRSQLLWLWCRLAAIVPI